MVHGPSPTSNFGGQSSTVPHSAPSHRPCSRGFATVARGVRVTTDREEERRSCQLLSCDFNTKERVYTIGSRLNKLKGDSSRSTGLRNDGKWWTVKRRIQKDR